ncbi:MAG: hypothetical protein QOF08_2427 [Gaiellales bacterium]|jgi:uncharacterized HhH-GPD family protein|nr:hypothetical protein [Gaiellales bacterium]
MASTTTAVRELPWTKDPEANRLLASDPNALLIGFVLDQQVTVQKAFAGPLELSSRLGHLDPAKIAALDPDRLSEVFREKPALHRFPGTMAERVQALCSVLADEYGGDGSRVWREAKTGQDLVRRLGELPGIGDMKVRSLVATLIKQFGIKPDGWQEVLPDHPTLGDADSPEALAEYQAHKRARKLQARALRERTPQ